MNKKSRYRGKPRRKSRAADKRAGTGNKKADLWGYHAVRAAWLNPEREINALYGTRKALENFEHVLKEAAKKNLNRPDPVVLDRKGFDKILKRAVHQGLALDVEPLPEVFVSGLIAKAALNGKSLLVMLDQVTDPHNVGAIMRSISALGAHGLVMQTRHSPGITGTLAKTACGAVEHVPLAYETNLNRALTQLQEAGFKAVALDERGEQTIGEIEKHDKMVIILGAEGKGLRQNLRQDSDRLVRLPTVGPIRSLNVSNAAAVALYSLMSD